MKPRVATVEAASQMRGVSMQSSSAAKPAMSESSAEVPAMDGVFVWYNIGWMRSRFNKLQKHEATLKSDLLEGRGKESC